MWRKKGDPATWRVGGAVARQRKSGCKVPTEGACVVPQRPCKEPQIPEHLVEKEYGRKVRVT